MYTNRITRSSLVFFVGSIALVATSARAADEPSASSQQESGLLAVLSSDAAPAEKAVTCKLLAIHGSSKAVPALAKLLPDPQLSSWARIALETIPGSESDEALRQAADSLEGRLLVGMLNSIGVRRDANAVELLTTRLKDEDVEVASAAAVALGRIGNPTATEALRGALASAPAKVRSAVAEGCVLCAERLHLAGNAEEAIKIYDHVRKAEVPKQRIIEATRGAILARGDDGIPLLIEQFQSSDKQMFQLALGTARELSGTAVDKALAAELAGATPDRAALLIYAMADRPETIELAAVLKAAGQGPTQVRLAAVDAIGRVGDETCLETLLDIGLESDAELAEAAKTALAGLASEKVDSRLVALLANTAGKSYPLLIDLVGQRRIDAVPQLLKALDHSDSSVRHAALAALGETVALDNLTVLVSQTIAPSHAEDAPVAQQALRAASVRMPDREACAEELTVALKRSPAATKSTLLEILSEVGGAKALQTLAAAAKSPDPEMQDTSSRLLGKWNSVEAAPVLLDLAKNAPTEKYQVRALRGYIGLARKFSMPEGQRVAMCQSAIDATERLAERKLVLEVLQIHPSVEALNLATAVMRLPELKKDATHATLVIAQKIGDKVDVSEQLSKAGLDKVKVEIVKAEYGAGSTQKDVTSILRRQVGDLPLIALKSSTYNTSFGGDPAPGTVKRLKIQYRINGQVGEASFAENELIVLPTPN